MPAPDELQKQLDLLTQRPSQQSNGGFPILTPYTTHGNEYKGDQYIIPQPRPRFDPTPDFGDLAPILKPPPSLVAPGLTQVPGFSSDIMNQITGLLGSGDLLPQEKAAIDIISGAVARQGAGAEAKRQSDFARRGLSGSSIEAFGLAEQAGQTSRAIAESTTPVAVQFAERAARRQEQLAGIISDIGKMDVMNQRDALFKLTDNLISVGQFNIQNIMQLKNLGAQLIAQEIENLRRSGLDEARLAQEKELKEKELANQLEQIRLKAQEQIDLAKLQRTPPFYAYPSFSGTPALVPSRPGQALPPGASFPPGFLVPSQPIGTIGRDRPDTTKDKN